MSPSETKHKETKWAKNSWVQAQLRQTMDNKIHKDQKLAAATSEEPGAKAGYAQAPALNTTEGGADHLNLQTDPWTHPSIHPT